MERNFVQYLLTGVVTCNHREGDTKTTSTHEFLQPINFHKDEVRYLFTIHKIKTSLMCVEVLAWASVILIGKGLCRRIKD